MSGYAHPTVIGQVTIPAPFEHTRYYEYAAYFQTIIVEPGTYDIVATYSSDTWADQKPYYMTVTVQGLVRFSNPAPATPVSDMVTHEIQLYGYQADDAEGIWRGTITWAPGFEVQDAWNVEGTETFGAHVVPVTMTATLEQRALGGQLNADAARRILRVAQAGEYQFGSYTDIETNVAIAASRLKAALVQEEHMNRILARHQEELGHITRAAVALNAVAVAAEHEAEGGWPPKSVFDRWMVVYGEEQQGRTFGE
jgi:hypothetical protein